MAIGDIEQAADVPIERPVRLDYWGSVVGEPAVLPVVSTEPIFHLEGFPASDCRRLCCYALLEVVGMHVGRPTLPPYFVEGAAYAVQVSLAQVHNAVVGTRCPDHGRRVLGNEAESLL